MRFNIEKFDHEVGEFIQFGRTFSGMNLNEAVDAATHNGGVKKSANVWEDRIFSDHIVRICPLISAGILCGNIWYPVS